MECALSRFILATIIASLIAGTTGLKCYACGGSGEEACEDFEKPSPNSSFVMDCDLIGPIEFGETKSQSIISNCFNATVDGHLIRSCGWSAESVNSTNTCENNICTCDTDLCNSRTSRPNSFHSSVDSFHSSAALLVATTFAVIVNL